MCVKLAPVFTFNALMTPDASPLDILLVDDEPAIADTLIYSLMAAGFAVHHVSTLASARSHLINATPALVVLDLGLPAGSGLDLCREIRRTREVPILMLTAKSDEVDRIVQLELGADDYVTKPFSPREVGLHIKTLRAELRSVDPTRDVIVTHRGLGYSLQWPER